MKVPSKEKKMKKIKYIEQLEKEARVAGRPLVNLLGTNTYKHINLRASGPRIELSL